MTLLSIAALLSAGCSTAIAQWIAPPTPTATAVPASPTATATRTLTPTPPATPTPSPMPTAVPAPTATPTPPPPDVVLSLPANPVVQGHTVVVRVTASRPVTVAGTLGDRPLSLIQVGDGEYWAIAGIHALAEPGPRQVVVTAVDELGREVRRQATLDVIPGDFETETLDLSPETAKLLDPELVQAELERLQALWAKVTPRQLWRKKWTRPGGTATTSAFGTRRSYDGGPATSYHAGQDFQAVTGTPVLAPAAGIVVLAEPLVVRGNAVWIDHGLGVYSGYFHLSEISVEAGQAVAPGDLLGLAGSTGLATGPHIHWEVRVHGIAVDPLEWTARWIGPPLRLRIDDRVR